MQTGEASGYSLVHPICCSRPIGSWTPTAAPKTTVGRSRGPRCDAGARAFSICCNDVVPPFVAVSPTSIAGLDRAKAQGKKLGRRPVAAALEQRIRGLREARYYQDRENCRRRHQRGAARAHQILILNTSLFKEGKNGYP